MMTVAGLRCGYTSSIPVSDQGLRTADCSQIVVTDADRRSVAFVRRGDESLGAFRFNAYAGEVAVIDAQGRCTPIQRGPRLQNDAGGVYYTADAKPGPGERGRCPSLRWQGADSRA